VFRDAASIKAQKKLNRNSPKIRNCKLAKQARDLQTVLDKEGVTMSDSARRDRSAAGVSAATCSVPTRIPGRPQPAQNEELGQIQQKARKEYTKSPSAKRRSGHRGGVVYVNPKLDITEKVLKLLEK
jgi:outer membrane protein